MATLRNMSQMFGNLGRTVRGVDADKKALYDRYKELAAEARKVAAETEAADVSESDEIRRNNLAFSRVLGEINDVITRMSETTSTAYVRVVNQNLGSLTTTSRPGDTVEQKQALERLEGLKDAAVKVVAQISGGRRTDDDAQTQAFTMIPAARAVWVIQGGRLLRVGRRHRARSGADDLRHPAHARPGRSTRKRRRRSGRHARPGSRCRCRERRRGRAHGPAAARGARRPGRPSPAGSSASRCPGS